MNAARAAGVRSARRGAIALLAILAASLVTLLATLPGARAHSHALHCAEPEGRGPGGVPALLAPTTAVDPAPPAAGITTIAMLPDVQYYTECRSPHLAAQVNWLAAQAARRNVRVAAFMGDLTEHDSEPEWSYFHDQIAPAADGVPLVLTTGNHDLGYGGSTHERHTLLTDFFPQPPGQAKTLLAEQGKSGGIANAYYRIPLPKVTLGVLALEWAPRASTVAWANAVLDRYPADRVIIVTHAYLYDDSTRYDWPTRGKDQLWNPNSYGMATWENWLDREHDGQMLWNALVRRHRGVFLVLCGHVGGTGHGLLASRGDAGNLVQQVLANFQDLDEGGLGYMRLFEIQPDGRSMRMKTYSPSLAVYAIGDGQQAELPIEPALW